MREKDKVKKKLSKKNDSRFEVGLTSLSSMAGKLICTIHSNNFKLTRRGPVSLVISGPDHTYNVVAFENY